LEFKLIQEQQEFLRQEDTRMQDEQEAFLAQEEEQEAFLAQSKVEGFSATILDTSDMS
jgi:hypothetical protein